MPIKFVVYLVIKRLFCTNPATNFSKCWWLFMVNFYSFFLFINIIAINKLLKRMVRKYVGMWYRLNSLRRLPVGNQFYSSTTNWSNFLIMNCVISVLCSLIVSNKDTVVILWIWPRCIDRIKNKTVILPPLKPMMAIIY